MYLAQQKNKSSWSYLGTRAEATQEVSGSKKFTVHHGAQSKERVTVQGRRTATGPPLSPQFNARSGDKAKDQFCK